MLKRFVAAIFAAWVAVAGAQVPLNTVTGTITTENLVSAGDCTAGSCVEIDVTGIASVTVQTKGTYTGALSAQVTVDRKTWVTECSSSCTSTFTRRTTGVQSATITSGEQDIYQVQFANGAKRLRITALGAVTGTATITIQPSNVGAGSSSGGGAGDASAANQSTMITSLSVLDDWDESDRAKVNPIAGQAGIAGGSGAAGATTTRTITATDSPELALVGATNEAAPASDTAAAGVNGRLQRIAQNLTTLNTSVNTGLGYSAAVSLTRTADTNAYTANDVIGAATGSTAALTFSSMGPASGKIMLTSISLEIDASAVISGETSYRLYLYNVTPPSALGDNAAFDLPSGDRASFLGYVDLGTVVDLGSTLYVQTTGVNRQLTLAASGNLFGYLVTVGAYTPTSARVHVITLNAVAM